MGSLLFFGWWLVASTEEIQAFPCAFPSSYSGLRLVPRRGEKLVFRIATPSRSGAGVKLLFGARGIGDDEGGAEGKKELDTRGSGGYFPLLKPSNPPTSTAEDPKFCAQHSLFGLCYHPLGQHRVVLQLDLDDHRLNRIACWSTLQCCTYTFTIAQSLACDAE